MYLYHRAQILHVKFHTQNGKILKITRLYAKFQLYTIKQNVEILTPHSAQYPNIIILNYGLEIAAIGSEH